MSQFLYEDIDSGTKPKRVPSQCSDQFFSPMENLEEYKDQNEMDMNRSSFYKLDHTQTVGPEKRLTRASPQGRLHH